MTWPPNRRRNEWLPHRRPTHTRGSTRATLATDIGAPGVPVWIHGDLLAGNLLVQEGRLGAVIDFGALGLGDPAPDLQPAWASLPAHVRADTAPAFARRGLRTVAAVLDDLEAG